MTDHALENQSQALRQRVGNATGLLWISSGLVVLLAITLSLGLLDDRMLNGVSIWDKPAKFSFSLALHAVTLAWGLTLVPDQTRNRKSIWWATNLFILAVILEMSWMTFQASRGEASHFNTATPFTSFMYTLMGIGAVTLTTVTIFFGWTDELQIWADQAVTVISVNDEIRIQAQTKIELIGGQSKLLLEGGNITFSCPGLFEVKSSMHNFLGGGSNAASVEALPVGKVGVPPLEIELHYDYDDLSPVVGAPYKVTFEDGTVRQGSLNSTGYALLSGVPPGAYSVEYGEDARDWKADAVNNRDAEFFKGDVQAEGKALIERMLQREPSVGGSAA